MVFDAVNETLDHHRVGKLHGEHLPFKLLWQEQLAKDSIACDRVLKAVTNSIIDWGSFMCGFIENKDDSLMQLPFALDEELLSQIKEDRMFKLLQNDVKEYEGRLQINDDETYEVMLEISNMVFEFLVDDLVDCSIVQAL